MSLNKIGKATTLAKALDSFKLGGSISDTISSLRAFGNVNDAAKYLAKNRGSLPDATSIWMLQQAYGKNSMVEETMQSELSKNQIVQNEGIGKSAGLFASFKNVGSGIATVFKSIAPMMIPLIIGAVGIKAGKMLWDNVLTDNAAQKNLQESVQKYKTEKSDLDNLQSQKETNKQRVYELRAKSNRTSAEDNELNNLLNEDSILDTQIGLKKRTVTSAQKQQALDAKKALEKRTFQGELFGKSPYPVYQDTNIGYAQKLMSGLEDEKQARKDVLNNKEWSSERKEAELKAKDKTIASYETELADVMSDISSNAQDLYDEDGNLIDKKNTQDLANNINDLFKAYSMLTNSSDYVSDKMDNIYSSAGHTHTKAQVGLGNVDNTADANKSVKHATTADSATTAGTATNVSAGEGTADAARHVWFSDSTIETKRAYSDKFKYNPVTNNLTVNVTGNAATASSVAWGDITGKPSTYAPSAHNHSDGKNGDIWITYE